VRRVLGKNTKAGHGGTLDSSASGLLVILVGAATRMSSLVMMMPKTYRARVALGFETTTCDASGEATLRGDLGGAAEADIDRNLPSFLGWRMQVPPQISAVHVGGRRAHEMARSGEEPVIEPRPVFIEQITRVSPLSEDGRFDLYIRCGKGTYVRSIARDLGRTLGCGAHLASLTRERVGPMGLDEAYKPDDDFAVSKDDLTAMIKPLDILKSFLPCYRMPDSMTEKILSGQSVPADAARRTSPGDRCPSGIVMVRSRGVLSICRLSPRGSRLFLTPETNIAFEECSE